MIKDRQVCSETRSFYQVTQVRQSYFSQRHTLCRLSTKTEHTYAEGVLAGFGVAMNVTATNQSAEEVAGRTLGKLREPADLGSAKAVVFTRKQFKDRESTLNRSYLLSSFTCPRWIC
jgi:hypothetical protein